MQKKEIFLSLDILAKLGASEELLEFFKENYPNDSASISKVLSDLQELANTSTEYVDSATLSEVVKKLQELANTDTEYVDYAFWLIRHFPPTQEPLVLNELNRKVIICNGDLTIKTDFDGEKVIIVNGKLNIEGNANLKGDSVIWAEKTIDAINIAADGYAVIGAEKTNVQKITPDDWLGLHGDINIIQPSSNPQNVTQPAD